MKKAAVAVLVIFLLLTSCGQPDDSSGDYDFNRSFSHINSNVYDTEDTVYFLYGRYSELQLRYGDKSTGISGPLCGKPECMHNNANCNAYVPSFQLGMFGYNGKLYFVGREQSKINLYSIAYDGNDRRIVRDLSHSLFPSSLSNWRLLAHRGYLYLSTSVSDIVNGDVQYGELVLAYDMDSDEEGVVVFQRQHPAGTSGRVTILPYGDNLYIQVYTYTYTSEDSTYGLELYQWNSATQELTTLYVGDAPSSMRQEMWVNDDHIFLMGNAHVGTGKFVYSFDIENCEIRQLFDFNSDEESFTKLAFAEDMVIGFRSGNDTLTICAKDFNGQTVFRKTAVLPGLGEDNIVEFCGATSETMYFYFLEGFEEAFGAVPIGDGEPRLLWNSKT